MRTATYMTSALVALTTTSNAVELNSLASDQPLFDVDLGISPDDIRAAIDNFVANAKNEFDSLLSRAEGLK